VQDTAEKRGHLTPASIVPIMFLTVERREQRQLGGAVVGFNADHIHPDIPFTKRAPFKSGIGGVVEIENKEGDELCKQPPRSLCQIRTTLGQPELTSVMTSQTQGDQQVMQHLERRELILFDNLVIAEHVFRAASRPIKMLYRPMNEDALECLRLRQTDGPVLLRVLQRQQRQPRRAQQGRMRQVRTGQSLLEI